MLRQYCKDNNLIQNHDKQLCDENETIVFEKFHHEIPQMDQCKDFLGLSQAHCSKYLKYFKNIIL